MRPAEQRVATVEAAATRNDLDERFVLALAHGSMSVELYAPRGTDPQKPHAQDELYFIHSGTGQLRIGREQHAFRPGDCFFVPAGA